MKICYLASAASIHTVKWAKYFSGRGDQVHVLSFEAGGEPSDNLRFHALGAAQPFKLHYFSAVGRVRSLLREIRPDILHAHYASGYATLGRLARYQPYVVSVWGSDVFDFPKTSPLHRWLVRANVNSAVSVCSTSSFMADKIQPWCKRKVQVTPFGVDSESFRPVRLEDARREFVVGMVKTLEPKYGVEYLIRAFALAWQRGHLKQKALRLMIAGSGSLREYLERLAVDLGVGEQTTFLGSVPHQCVPQLLNQFSVFVAPSVMESESFGVAVIEASACGLPVIASRIGGLPEVVKDGFTGILVPPRDPVAIANALEELLQNEELAARFGANGRQFVLQNYEWTENARRMERIYADLLGPGVLEASSLAASV